MAVQTRTDRRFRRVHLTPTRRRRGPVTGRVLTGAALVLASIGAFLIPGVLRTASFLQVTTITVEGTSRVSDGEVRALIGQLRGQNILVADLEAYRGHLLTSGWVAQATLRRVLPSTVEVTLVEREPAGLARFNGRLYLIDGMGTVIEEHGPRFADVDLPIVDGLSSGTGVVDQRRAELVSNLLTALTADPDLSARVSQINVEDAYDAVVLLNDGPTLIHLGDERFVERLRTYLELAPTLHAYVAEID